MNYFVITFMSTLFPYGVVSIVMLTFFSCVSLDEGISALLVITPSKVLAKRKVRNPDGTTESLLVVKGRIVPANKTIKTMIMLCLTIGSILSTTLGLFIHSIYTIKNKCPPLQERHQWTCYAILSGNVADCFNRYHPDPDVKCIKYSGNIAFATGAALACYKLNFILFLVITFLFEKIAKKIGKCCCRFLFFLLYIITIAIVLGLFFARVHIDNPITYRIIVIALGCLPLMYACYDIRSDQKQSVVVEQDEHLHVINTPNTITDSSAAESELQQQNRSYQRNPSHSLIRFLIERCIFNVHEQQRQINEQRGSINDALIDVNENLDSSSNNNNGHEISS